uniref:Uncharacterized protein n=1 Tax=Tanacetum cinerariifolium TaxID=118510 RepID=A0A6L2J4D3_TANCI|nr:hypothetical protein [Tanacetum cinerariifolium]
MQDKELDHLLEGTENADVDEFMNDIFNSQEDSSTRIEPKREKESLEAKNSVGMVTINDEVEEESAGDKTHKAHLSTDKETLQELTIITEDAPSSADKEKLKELTVSDPTPSSYTPSSSSSPKPKLGWFRQYKSFIQQMGGRYGLLFGHLKNTFMPRKNFNELS